MRTLMSILNEDKTEYEVILRDIYLGLAMHALIPMIDSKEAGEKMPMAALDIAKQLMEVRKNG
jgi:hypothetical protein